MSGSARASSRTIRAMSRIRSGVASEDPPNLRILIARHKYISAEGQCLAKLALKKRRPSSNTCVLQSCSRWTQLQVRGPRYYITSWNDARRRTRSEEESRDLAPPSGIGRVINCVVRGLGLEPQSFRAGVLFVKSLAEFCWNHFIASSEQKCDRTMIIF